MQNCCAQELLNVEETLNKIKKKKEVKGEDGR